MYVHDLTDPRRFRHDAKFSSSCGAFLGDPVHQVAWTDDNLERLKAIGFNEIQLNIAWGNRPFGEPLNLIDVLLTLAELAEWRSAVEEAVAERRGIKIPGTDIKTGNDDGINKEDADYFANVFDQLLNLWQTNERVRKLMMSDQLGEMACRLSGARGIRIWHDQALIKRPWANPTTLHLDAPFWSFSSPDSLSIWVALDDATLENGCLYFLPGSHTKTGYQNIGITSNMNAIFQVYPQLTSFAAVATPIRAGSASFHNGLCIHGAGPNMTPRPRRAMTCAYMPEGSTFNGQKNILSEEYVTRLKVGDLLDDDLQNPLIYSLEGTSGRYR